MSDLAENVWMTLELGAVLPGLPPDVVTTCFPPLLLMGTASSSSSSIASSRRTDLPDFLCFLWSGLVFMWVMIGWGL